MNPHVATPDWQPTLEGVLVQLRPIEESDFEALRAIASDPLLWEQHPIKNRTEPAVFRTWFNDALAGRALVVVECSSNKTIGTSRYKVLDERRRNVEIGWTFLARTHWGGAHNGELKKLMIDHAFGWADVITFKAHEHNLRSMRAIEKLGAKRVGVERSWHGLGCSVIYELTPAIWTGQPRANHQAAAPRINQ